MQVAYFFTTANMANEKLENDIVEKCPFTVKRKQHYTLSLTVNVMFCKSTVTFHNFQQ